MLFEQGNPLFLLSADRSRFGLLARAQQVGLPHAGFECRHWSLSLAGLMQFRHDALSFEPLLKNSLSEFKPDLIHANTLRSALLLKRQQCRDIPVLLHDRDLKAPFISLHIAARRIHTLIAVSAATAEKWRSLLPSENIHVVYNGLSLPELETAPFETRTGFCILQVADLLPWKNHRLFLQVLRKLSGRIPGLRAIIRGRRRGRESAKLLQVLEQQARELNLEACLEIRTADGDATAELQEADLLISCSEQEAFGRNIIEALAHGKVVVAVKAAGPAEILAQCTAASLCPPDAEALAQAVMAWHADQKYLHAAEDARKFAAEFSLDKHLQNINYVYDKMIYEEG
ncbi:MAG: glycosyltransferase [Oligosphaeraceae bacterium]|nr:glycosyltransferase [Oligosphaeraceae bacterium]